MTIRKKQGFNKKISPISHSFIQTKLCVFILAHFYLLPMHNNHLNMIILLFFLAGSSFVPVMTWTIKLVSSQY